MTTEEARQVVARCLTDDDLNVLFKALRPSACPCHKWRIYKELRQGTCLIIRIPVPTRIVIVSL
jgi:hypothetical protein